MNEPTTIDTICAAIWADISLTRRQASLLMKMMRAAYEAMTL